MCVGRRKCTVCAPRGGKTDFNQIGVRVAAVVECASLVVSGVWFYPKHSLGEMVPWTIGLVLDLAPVDELLDLNHRMDNAMELRDTLLLVHRQLRARVVHTTQLYKWAKGCSPWP